MRLGLNSRALDGLRQSHQTVAQYLTIQQHSDRDLAYGLKQMRSQNQRDLYKGYEHLIGAYFEALAQTRDAVKDRPGEGSP